MTQRRSQARSSRSQSSIGSQQSLHSQQSRQSSQSQLVFATQSQSQTQVTDEVLEETAVEVVNFLLDYQEFGVPIKRQMITKNVPKTQGRHVFRKVMDLSKKKLDDIFGIELVELTNKKDLRFILTNNLKSDLPEINVDLCNTNILTKTQRNLLLLILTVVLKSGGEVKESTLLEFCRRARIIESLEKPIIISPYFAGIDLLKFLRNDLVDRLYLECKVNDADGENEMRFYSWGLRAENGVDEEELEAYYQTIYQMNQ